MALVFVGGAALGTLFGALYDGVKLAIGSTTSAAMRYKSLLADLKFTLDCLEPHIIQQIGDRNVELRLPNEIIESLQGKMTKGKNLILKLSKLSMWNCYIWCSCCCCCNSTEPSYSDQLAELDRDLRILLERLKLHEASNVQGALALARDIRTKQDELLRRQSEILKMQQEAGDMLRAQLEARDLRIEGNTEAVVYKQAEGSGVQGAALIRVFGVLFRAIIQVKDKTRMFKRILEYLKSTLDSLKPMIDGIVKYNSIVHLPKEEVENFVMQMENGVELVYKCSKVHWWESYKKYKYTNKLLVLNQSLQRLLNTLREQLARNLRESFDAVRDLEMEIKRIEEGGVARNQIECEGFCPKPEPPAFGLNLQLNVQGTDDVKETLDSTRNIEAAVKQIDGSIVVQNQIDNAITECSSLTVGLDVMDTPEIRGEERVDSTRDTEASVKRIVGSGLLQDQVEISVHEPSSPIVGLNVPSMQGTRDVKEALESAANIKLEQSQQTLELEAPDAELYAPSSVTVGLDVLMWELKKELLKDEVSALVLTGPRGSGKTTLATLFCVDEEMKAIFKNNIFFVCVSENPNLSFIVQKLYQKIEHKGYRIPALQDEAVALNWLQQFMKETGQNPSLLVLDDVRPESQFLLHKFDEFKTSNHKILVTSRYEFPTFGAAYHLQSLDDNDLVCVSAASWIDEDSGAHFHDSTASILGDGSSNVSKDVGSMAHFHDSLASSVGDGSSYVLKDGTKKSTLDDPVKSLQTQMQQKLELKVSGGDKKMKKILKAVNAMGGVAWTSWDVENQKLTVVGQLDPALITTKLRKIASKTEVISVGPAKEEIKEDKKEGKKERNPAMKEEDKKGREKMKGIFLPIQPR